MKRKLLLLFFCCGLVGLFSFNHWMPAYHLALADATEGDGTQPVDYGSLSTNRPLSKSETVFVTDVVESQPCADRQATGD